MPITRRIYFSMPSDDALDTRQNDLKWAIVAEVERLGYAPQIFFDPQGRRGLPSGKAWNFPEVDRVARRCVGAVVVGLPRWTFHEAEGRYAFPSEYCHYEGAVAYTLGLPLLLLAEKDVMPRGIFYMGAGLRIAQFPQGADQDWLQTSAFQVPFSEWRDLLARRRDVFLGYASSSEGTARNIKRYMEKEVGATVLDWKADFAATGSILEQIQEAADRCSAGVFLFTKDDKLQGKTEQAVPRDNVVFEAGFFAHARGEERVLIVRERGSKMPADLGGNIYATLEDRSNITPIEDQLRRFLEQRL